MLSAVLTTIADHALLRAGNRVIVGTWTEGAAKAPIKLMRN